MSFDGGDLHLTGHFDARSGGSALNMVKPSEASAPKDVDNVTEVEFMKKCTWVMNGHFVEVVVDLICWDPKFHFRAASLI